MSPTLIDRLRAALDHEPTAREVAMFGGRSFMVNEKMIVSARGDGSLLVRVDAARHDELVHVSGADTAVMGRDRVMGPGWIAVAAEALQTDAALAFWIDRAMEYNHRIVGDSPA